MSQSYRLRISRNALKVRTATRIPAQLVGGSGVTITKTNGVYTFDMDEGEIQDIATAAAQAAIQIGVVTQAYDADLDALAANSTNGLWARTGAGTGAARTLTAPAAGISVSNGNGVSGNPTLALANDLSALEGLSTSGHARRTGTDAWAIDAVGQLTATATNDNAAAGKVGEYIESILASGSATALTTATAKTVTSISLTAGDWDVDTTAYFTTAASTSVTQFMVSISGTTNTVDTTPGKLAVLTIPAVVPTAGTALSISLPPYRLSLSGTTTIYMVVQGTFTAAALTAFGIIRARRAR